MRRSVLQGMRTVIVAGAGVLFLGAGFFVAQDAHAQFGSTNNPGGLGTLYGAVGYNGSTDDVLDTLCLRMSGGKNPYGDGDYGQEEAETNNPWGCNGPMWRQLEHATRVATSLHTFQLLECITRDKINLDTEPDPDFLECQYSNLAFGTGSTESHVNIYFDDIHVGTVRNLMQGTAGIRIIYKYKDNHDGTIKLFMEVADQGLSEYELKSGIDIPYERQYLIRYEFIPGTTNIITPEEDATYRMYLDRGINQNTEVNAPPLEDEDREAIESVRDDAVSEINENPDPITIPTETGEESDDTGTPPDEPEEPAEVPDPPQQEEVEESTETRIQLHRGYNMVSPQSGSVRMSSVHGCGTVKFLRFNPDLVGVRDNPYDTIITSGELYANEGYWVYAHEACTLVFTEDESSANYVGLRSGYNQISIPESGITAEDIREQCDITQPFYSYNGREYIPVQGNLDSRTGYWAYSEKQCQVNGPGL